MNEARDCQGTDPRDKIYALLPSLNAKGAGLHIAPDYELPTVDVYTEFAIAMLPQAEFTLLQAVQSFSNIEGLPSWAPDSTQPLTHIPFEHRQGLRGVVTWKTIDVAPGPITSAPISTARR